MFQPFICAHICNSHLLFSLKNSKKHVNVRRKLNYVNVFYGIILLWRAHQCICSGNAFGDKMYLMSLGNIWVCRIREQVREKTQSLCWRIKESFCLIGKPSRSITHVYIDNIMKNWYLTKISIAYQLVYKEKNI